MWGRVPPKEWDLSALPAVRRKRLECAAAADTLISQVISSAMLVSAPACENSAERTGYIRAVAQFRISADLFDLLFNGPTGYRAQYYLSESQGDAANRLLTRGLSSIIAGLPQSCSTSSNLCVVNASLDGPWTKIWPRNHLFIEAPCNELRARRWVSNCISRSSQGLKAPFDQDGIVELKGTFTDPTDGKYWLDPCKEHRSKDIHLKGHS